MISINNILKNGTKLNKELSDKLLNIDIFSILKNGTKHLSPNNYELWSVPIDLSNGKKKTYWYILKRCNTKTYRNVSKTYPKHFSSIFNHFIKETHLILESKNKIIEQLQQEIYNLKSKLVSSSSILSPHSSNINKNILI